MGFAMEQEKIIAWTDIVTVQMNHWTFFAILSTISILSGVAAPPVALWLLCMFLPVSFFFIRRYTNGFLIMAGSHILCLALLFQAPAPHVLVKAFLCLYGTGCAVYSFVIRIRSKERLDEPIAPAVAVAVISFSLFVLHYAGHTDTGADIYYMGMAVIYLACYFIRYYFQHYLRFLTVNAGSTGYIPRKEIFLSGAKLSAAFTISWMALLLLASNIEWLSWIFASIRKGIVWLRENVFSLLALLLGNDDYTPLPRSTEGGGMNQLAILPEAGETSMFWVILEKAVFTVMPLLLIAGICFALFRSILFLKEHFAKKRYHIAAETNGEARDIREKYEARKEKKPARNLPLFLSPTEKIRRIYKQKIQAKHKSLAAKGATHPISTYTARECCRLFSEEPLAAVYEKARYSNEICTKEDVRKAAGK